MALSPLVGALLGGVGGGIMWVMPNWIGALTTVVFWMLWQRMALPHLVVSFAVLLFIPHGHVVVVCIMAQCISRAAMVAFAWTSRPADNFLVSLTSTAALIAIAQGLAISLLLGWRYAVLIVSIAYLILRGAQWFFYKRIGGVNENSLQVVSKLMEVSILILFALPLFESGQ